MKGRSSGEAEASAQVWRAAIVGGATVVGQELKELLAGSDLGIVEPVLLSVEEAAAPGLHATLTDFAGEAVVETPLSASELEGVDVAFVCDARAADHPALGAARFVIDVTGASPEGPVVVSGCNEHVLGAGRVFRSPHAASVLLAHVMSALSPIAPGAAHATVMLPASEKGRAGMDELMAQTRAALSFSPMPSEVLGHQLAFNLWPSPEAGGGGPGRRIADEVRQVLSRDLQVAVLQVPVFYTVSCSLWVELPAGVGRDRVLAAFGSSPHLRLSLDGDASPVGIAGEDEVVIGAVEHGGRGAFVWAICDNARRGASLNALEVARALRGIRDRA
jgi:aspartate-semialdehyde dehydrogenase